jgi:TPR repeat protein/transglutaminase-like putative cysteine protease
MRLLLIVFIALVTSATSAWAASPAKPPVTRTGASAFARNPILPKWAEPLEQVPPTKSEEPVVIRLAEAQYWTGANPAYLVNRAVQVNSSSRLSELGQFSISFAPAYQKLVLHRIAILRGDQVLDRTATASVRVLDGESDAEKGYYYGESTVKVLLEDVKPGDTLWTIYSVEGNNPVFGSTWTEHLPWTKTSPMELRKVVVLQPSSKAVQWRVSGAARSSLPEPSIERRNGVSKLVFRETSVAADEFEASMPPDLIPMPILDLSEYKDWGQVAQWATALFPNMAGNADVQKLVRQFDGATAEDRASQALHWVQDEIRYFSVSIGENSHRPQPPEVVLKRRFGDCKDKSQLLVALYRAMGLEAQPVLLHALAPKFPAQFLPSPASFNHAIVRVVLNGKAYFVDPTLQDERGPISGLAVPVPKAAALIVSSDTTGLITLPDEVMDEPLVDRSERMTIPALRGDAQLQLRTEYRGRSAAGMRQFYRSLSSIDLKKMLLEQFERTYPGVQLVGSAKLSDAAGGSSFVVEAQLTIPKVLREENGIFQLAQRTHVLEGTLGIPDKLVRKYPLWLAAGHYRARYNLDVSLPGEARLVKDDDRIAVETKYFDARGQLTWRGAHLNYYLDYVITNPEVAPSDLPGLVEQVHKLDPLFESKLRFKPLSVPPQAAKEASLRVLDIMEKLRAYEGMQAEALRTGKVPELKFEESVYANLNYRALCESVLDINSVREWNPILRAPVVALYKIVETRADKRTKDLCTARLNFIDHDLLQASKDLAALAPDDSDPLTLMQAWADFHAREPVRARSNLARFLKAKNQAGALSADDAILALALSRRLGIAEPEEIHQLASTLRPGAWPMPLFSLLRGSLSAEDVLAAIELLPPAAREYATMEAHFFISQVHLAANEPRKADIHLNWFARYGLLGSAFEVLADADKNSESRADPDMREAWKREGQWGSGNSVVRHQKAAAEKDIAEAQYALGNRYLKGDGTRQDIPTGEALLESAAAKGHSGAMNDLGFLYENGKYVKQDNQRAFNYYRQAADNGNRYAAYNLGRFYWFGDHGVSIDFEQTFLYMKYAAELGDNDAQFFLSRLYFEGKGTDKNDTLAMFWAYQSHIRKDAAGTVQFGLLLLHLEVDPELRQTGLRLLMDAAARNNSFAQYELACLLLSGVGKETDPKGAFQLLNKAVLNRHEHSIALQGRMYVEGLGVRADVPKGMEMLARMEKKGLPEAYYHLGLIYRNDAVGMTDKARAADYFRRGAERGQRQAAESLAVMLHTGDGIARNLPEAVRYYEMAVKAGYPRAMNNLANMYENGQGVPIDFDKAMSLYRRAAQMGHSSAMLNLAEIYETSPLVKKSAYLPLAYYMLASKYGAPQADEGLNRVKASSDSATIEKAQTYVATWKPGKAMPEET